MSIFIDPADILKPIVPWLFEKAKFIHGVPRLVMEFQAELRLMKCLLIDAADYHGGGGSRAQTVRSWVIEIQEIAYDAEDVIETFVLRVESRRSATGIRASIKRYSCICHEWILRRNLGSDIKGIKGRILALRKSLPIYGVSVLNEEEGLLLGSGEADRRKRWGVLMRQTYPHDDEKDIVGLHGEVDKLVSVLVKEDGKHYHTICICGMGGGGKTTLARKIYNHSVVKHGFDCFAWTCISQQFNARDVLQEILIKLGPERREEILKLTEKETVEKLYAVLRSKKCLVVIDDIWSSVDWDHIKPAFPIGEMGSTKLLLTTRNTGLALHVDSHSYFHQPPLLNEDEAWELLHKKAFSTMQTTLGTV